MIRNLFRRVFGRRPDPEGMRGDLVDEINRWRARWGVPALVHDHELHPKASAFARSCVGAGPSPRTVPCRYGAVLHEDRDPPPPDTYAIVSAWMAYPDKRRIILSRRLERAGWAAPLVDGRCVPCVYLVGGLRTDDPPGYGGYGGTEGYGSSSEE